MAVVIRDESKSISREGMSGLILDMARQEGFEVSHLEVRGVVGELVINMTGAEGKDPGKVIKRALQTFVDEKPGYKLSGGDDEYNIEMTAAAAKAAEKAALPHSATSAASPRAEQAEPVKNTEGVKGDKKD